MSALVQPDLLTGEPLDGPTYRTPVRAYTRRVKGDAPPSGAERRNAALAQLEAKDAVKSAKEYVRAKLRALYDSRAAVDPAQAFVTADDVEAILRDWPQCPAVLRRGPQKWRGTVFAGKGWALTGRTVPSTRPEMRAHRNPAWRPVDASAPSIPSTPAERRTA
jgi:hypothetical protein